jgi:hypothetical protein
LDLRGSSWKRLHNKEFHNLYALPNVIRVFKVREIRWAGHVACMEVIRHACMFFTEKSEWKRPLRRPRHRW